MRKIRVLIQVGATKDYNTKQFVERDITLEVRDEEDMCKQLRFLMSDEYKAVESRLQAFPEARSLVDSGPEHELLV